MARLLIGLFVATLRFRRLKRRVLGVMRWVIAFGMVAALLFWKQRRRRPETVDEGPSGPRAHDAIDDALEEGQAAASRIGALANSLREVVAQIPDLLRSLPTHRARGASEE